MLSVHDATTGGAIGILELSFPAPWVAESSQLSDDEYEWSWTHPDGADARIRFSCATGCSWRVAISTRSDEPVEVPPARMSWTSDNPIHSWIAGSCAYLIMDHDLSTGETFLATMTRGFARSPDLIHAQPDVPSHAAYQCIAELGPSTTALTRDHGYSCVWTLDSYPHLAAIAAALPPWLPARTTLQSGEPLTLPLPDVATQISPVSGNAPAHHQIEEGNTVVSADHGIHQLHLTGPGIDAQFNALWGSASPLGDRAHQIVNDCDPRYVTPAQIGLVDQALHDHLIARSEADEFLNDALNTVVNTAINVQLDDHSSAPQTESASEDSAQLDPMLVPALIHAAQAGLIPAEQIVAMAGSFAPGAPGLLAWLSVQSFAASSGLRLSIAPPVDPADLLTQVLADEIKHVPLPTPQVWHAITLLRGPFPQRLDHHDLVQTALACAVLSLAPREWPIASRTGLSVEQLIDDTRLWAVAEHPDDQALYWLGWH